MPEFDQQALKQALKDLDGNPVALYQRLPQQKGITMPVVQSSHDGYYHGS